MVTSYLGGRLRQRRTGLGWRGLQTLPTAADSPTSTVLEVHDAFDAISALAGAGSQSARSTAVAELFGRATPEEQAWLRGVVTGEVRQGALDALVQEGVAAAAGVPLAAVRRAAMLAGSTVAIVRAAFDGGEEALAEFRLEVGRPVLPMLASSAPTIAEGMAKALADGEVAIDTKLDGIRIQVHRWDDEVLIATRTLEDITARLPEVVEVARALPAASFVLDGEALALDDDGRPRPFQETASRTAMAAGVHVTPYFFDLLYLDGADLLDRPVHERLAALDALVPEEHRTTRLVTGDADAAQEFVSSTLAAGHEGVVVKDPGSAYAAGRRGSSWVKVKPVHTLDLVVLAVEWGSGRRKGWLSNIHLGARDPDGGFVMLGKTFKGMTDEMLAVADRAVHRAGDVTGRRFGVRRGGAARAGRRDRLRRPAAVHPLPRRPRAALRPGGPLPRRQDRRRGGHDRDRAVDGVWRSRTSAGSECRPPGTTTWWRS